MVAPGVNAQVHQHMFCARLDVEVDGTNNVVDEVDLVTGCVGAAEGIGDPFANAFGPVKVSFLVYTYFHTGNSTDFKCFV